MTKQNDASNENNSTIDQAADYAREAADRVTDVGQRVAHNVRQMGRKGLGFRDSGRVRYEGRYRVDYDEATGTYHRRFIQDYGVRPDDYGFSMSWSWSHGTAR